MTVLTEGMAAGEFIVSEANKTRSREKVTIASGNNVTACMVLGIITASGKYKQHDAAAADGSQNAAAILFDNVDATAADKIGVALVRDCEVNGAELVWKAGITAPQKTAAIAALKVAGIIVR